MRTKPVLSAAMVSTVLTLGGCGNADSSDSSGNGGTSIDSTIKAPGIIDVEDHELDQVIVQLEVS